MKLDYMIINNFLSFAPEDQRYEFPKSGAWLVVGTKDTDGDSNGAGKSSFAEAIVWCLKGETIKGLKTDELVNERHGEKPFSVELCFTSGDNKYIVRRGRKGGKGKKPFLEFSIGASDETCQRIDATQSEIDKVFDVSFPTMNSAIICSADNDIPFLKMRSSMRKEILENLSFGPEFRVIEKLAKEERKTIKAEVQKLEVEYSSLKSSGNSKMESIKSYKENKAREIAELKEYISKFDGEDIERLICVHKYLDIIDKIDEVKKSTADERGRLAKKAEELKSHDIEGMREKLNLYDAMSKNEGILQNNTKELDNFKDKYVSKQSELGDKIKGLNNLNEELSKIKQSICFACDQPIDKPKTDKMRLEKQREIGDLEQDISQLKIELEIDGRKMEALVEENGKIEAEYMSSKKNFETHPSPYKQEREIDGITSELKHVESLLSRLDEDASLSFLEKQADEYRGMDGFSSETWISRPARTIGELEESMSQLRLKKDMLKQKEGDDEYEASEAEEIRKIMEKFREARDSYREKSEDLKYFEFISRSLGNEDFDDGRKCFKKFYIDGIIPFYNSKATEHLKKFFYEDDIEIKFDNDLNETIVRDGREKVYRQFSGGEKTRLDFSMLLTNNSLSRIKMSDSVNIIFLDEVLDGAVDKTGMEAFMEIIDEMSDDMVVYLTSHRDHLLNRFSNVLTVEKIQGNSYIKKTA